MQAARRAGEEFLLERNLFRHKATGENRRTSILLLRHFIAGALRRAAALDHLRASAQISGAPRTHASARRSPCAVAACRRPVATGRAAPWRQWFEVDAGPGMPSRWVTLAALRVLRWAET